ncbi:MAG TPA: hypothetical protein VHG93_07625 [Longimicrobium sp.]|nr:hypothetical protein [Longimicrobium sp.]
MDSTTTASPAHSSTEAAATLVDARPILRRTEDNVWDRAEQLRSQLYRLIEDTCRNLGFEALVLQSDPYIHPAWVKVESWKPERGGALTARSSMSVTITAMPYHLYEFVYRVDWAKQGRQGVTDHLHAFREHEVTQMLRFLLKDPDVPLFGDGEAARILENVQLRTEWWHIWKPRNRVMALRRDRVRAGSGVLLAAGAFMTLGGLASAAGGFDDGGGYDPLLYDTTAVVSVPGTDTVTSPFVDSVTVVPTTDSVVTTTSSDTTMAQAATPARLWLAADQDFTAWLDAGDRAFTNTGARYEDWSYYASAGERIAVTMRSTDFVPVVTLGQYVDGRWNELATPPGGAGPDSRLEFVVPADGVYVITAASRLPEGTGSYTLRLDRLGGA